MADRLVRFLSHVDMVKITCVETTALVEEARRIHGLNPTPTAALGRTLTMGAMMGANLKEEDGKITIQVLGKGPLGKILVVANQRAEVKGCVDNPMAEAPLNNVGKLNVSAIVGEGQLNVIKDIGLKEPYVGNVPLQTGEIAEDFAYYYAVSEQIPTAVALGVLVNQDGSVKKAGGYILQALPDTPDEILRLIENRIAESKSMTQMLEEGMSLEEIATYISDDLNTYVVDEIHPIYQCDCSRERMANAIFCLRKEDIAELAEDDTTEICCHFCNQKYRFSKEEIKELLSLK